MVKYLIEEGAEVDEKDHNGTTPLLRAIDMGIFHKLLLKKRKTIISILAHLQYRSYGYS